MKLNKYNDSDPGQLWKKKIYESSCYMNGCSVETRFEYIKKTSVFVLFAFSFAKQFNLLKLQKSFCNVGKLISIQLLP